MPNKMTVDRDEKGQLYYQHKRSNEEVPTTKGSTVELCFMDVLYISGLDLDGPAGYGSIVMSIDCKECGTKFE